MADLLGELNRLAGTERLGAAGAANAWAGTTGLELVGALNAKAGTSGLEFEAACRAAAGETDPTVGGLEALRAASALPDALTQAIGSWYDAKDGSGLQEVPSRITGTDLLQLGSTSGADAADPTWTASRDRWDIASGDYLQHPSGDIPTFTATTGKHTQILVFNVPTLLNNTNIWCATSGSANGLRMYIATEKFRVLVGGSTTSVAAAQTTELTIDTDHMVAAVVDNGSFVMWDDINGESSSSDITGVGTITFNDPRVASYAHTVSNQLLGDYYMVRTLPGVALTASELQEISDAVKSGNYS